MSVKVDYTPPSYIPIFHPQLRRLVDSVSDMSKDAVIDLAGILHYFGTGTVMEQLVGTPLSEALISHIAYNEMEVFRQRTIGSPAHDYIPIMRAWNKTIDRVASTLGWQYGRNKVEVHAKEYRRFQEVYINDLVAGLRKLIESGDETPSYLGNIMRTTSLNDEEILLSSYSVGTYLFLHSSDGLAETSPFSFYRRKCRIHAYLGNWLPRKSPRSDSPLLCIYI
jgi:phenylacetate 2-hydroxylase